MYTDAINAAVESYKKLLTEQLERNDRIKATKEFTDYAALDKIIIGVCGGDAAPQLRPDEGRALGFSHLRADCLRTCLPRTRAQGGIVPLVQAAVR